MKRPWAQDTATATTDALDAELAAADAAEHGLEELADLFAEELLDPTDGHCPPQQQQQPNTTRRKRARRELVQLDFGSQEQGSTGGGGDGSNNASQVGHTRQDHSLLS